MNEWISVKNQLPVDQGFYLATDGENVSFAHKSLYRFEMLYGFGTFVSHWMALPKPPEEK